jgi:hypothetical protein
MNQDVVIASRKQETAMNDTNRWMVAGRLAALLIAGLQLTACSNEVAAKNTEHPAELQAIPGSNVMKVTLTERASERLDVKTEQVREQGGQPLVPYSSVIYDPKGVTWVYMSPAPRTYVREIVEIDRIIGNQVLLKRGPAAGTNIASQAVAELYGAELKVGH